MNIWVRPLVGCHPGSDDPVDTGQDEVMVDDGLRVGYVGREANSPVCLIGQPSGELVDELRNYFGDDRKISFPSVLLDKYQNPILHSEEDDE